MLTQRIAFTLLVSAALVVPSRLPGRQGSGGVLLRQLYGELALDVRAADASAMRVTVADASHSVALILRARDIRTWADSANRILAARPKGKPPAGRWEAAVEEPGTRSGSMGLTRTINGKDTVIAVYFADSALTRVRTTLDAYEARNFVGAMKKAAGTYLNPKKTAP